MPNSPEKRGADALVARLRAGGRVAELAIVEVVLGAVRRHPVGDAGLAEFIGALAQAADGLQTYHARQAAVDGPD